MLARPGPSPEKLNAAPEGNHENTKNESTKPGTATVYAWSSFRAFVFRVFVIPLMGSIAFFLTSRILYLYLRVKIPP